jgi:hypothetical protein
MIKYILKIILFLFPIITNAQAVLDSILHSERSLMSELQRLSHVEIIRQFPYFWVKLKVSTKSATGLT